jgi:hypothetical protein
MSIRNKLIGSYLIITILVAVSGMIGFISLKNISSGMTHLDEYNLPKKKFDY